MTIKISQLGNISGVSDGTYFAAVDTSSILTSVKATAVQLKTYIQAAPFGNVLPNIAANVNATVGNVSRPFYSVYTGNVITSNVNTTSILGNTITGWRGNFSAVTGRLTTAAQPAITSVGTLSTLAVSGTVTAGFLNGDGSQIYNINITGANIQTSSLTLIGNLANLAVGGPANFYGNTQFNSANVSVSSSTGALVVAGGVGIGGALYVAGGISSPSLTGINANITTANTGMIGYVGQQVTTANVGMKGYVDAGNVGQIGFTNNQILVANTGMIGYVNNTVTNANTGAIGYFTAGNAGVVGYVGQQVTTANIGMIGYVGQQVTTANTGVVGYVGQQIATANVGIAGYVNNQILTANTGMIGYVNSTIATGSGGAANIGMKGYVDNAVVTANIGMVGYVVSQITVANTGVSSANIGMKGYVDNGLASANIGIKGYIDLGNSIQSVQLTSANLGIIGYIGQQVTNANTGVVGYVGQQVTTANIGQIGFTNNQILVANTGMIGYVGQQVTTANTGMIGYVGQQVTTANTGMIGYVGQQVTTANTGIKGYVDLANTIQSSQITSANLGIIGYVNNQISTATAVGTLTSLSVAGTTSLNTTGGSTTNYGTFQVGTLPTLWADSNTYGNVGFGTNTPDVFSQGLGKHVTFSAPTGYSVLNIQSNVGAGINFGNNTTRSAVIKADSASGNLQFYTNPGFGTVTVNEGMRLAQNGYLYNSPNSQLGLVQSNQFFMLSSNLFVVSTGVGDVRVFGVNVFVASNTIYQFESVFVLQRPVQATTSHVVSMNFGAGITAAGNIAGMATVTGTNYQFVSTDVATTFSSHTASQIYSFVSNVSNVAISTAVTSTAGANIFIQAWGTMTVGAGGWISPRIATSAIAGGNYYTLAGSFFQIAPMGPSGSNVRIGSFAV